MLLFIFRKHFELKTRCCFSNLHQCRRNTLQTKEPFCSATFQLDEGTCTIMQHLQAYPGGE